MKSLEKSNIQKQAELAARIKSGAVPQDFTIPGWSKDYQPFDYQLQGMLWLYLTPKAILADATGLGKAQPVDSLVATPNGWVAMGDLRLGDLVIGSDGKPVPVTGIFPQGNLEVYKLTFSDGSTVECSGDHLWTLYGHRGKKETLSVEQLLSRNLQVKSGQKSSSYGRDVFSLPPTPVVHYKNDDPLPIDPYVIGCLLGDGHLRHERVTFTSADSFIINEMENKLPDGYRVIPAGSPYQFNISYKSFITGPLMQYLRESRLSGTRSHTKFIPPKYLMSSIDDRLSLLQGLMDTDGSPLTHGGEFCTVSEALANDITSLARSLGFFCNGPKKSIGGYLKDGAKVKTKDRFRITIYGDLPLFRLPRKVERVTPRKYPRKRTLRKIEKTNTSKPMQCISVGAADHLYMTENFVLTHNTFQCLSLLTYLKHKAQVSTTNRAIIIVPATSVYSSWKSDGFDKFNVPLSYAVGRGTKQQRLNVYNDPNWEVLLTNYETVRNDIDYLEKLGFKHVILDEVDYIKNHATQTAKAVKRITFDASRVIAVSATPIQNSLLDLHSILEALGLKSVFGSKTAFDRHYHEHAIEQIRTRSRTIYKKKVIGYKNTEELKTKLDPYYLRRTYKDVDIKMPELKSQIKYVELTPEQKQLYEQVKRGFAKLKPNSPPKEIKAAALKLRQVCTGTASAGSSIDSSGKFDWLIKTLTSDWSDSKVVIFSNWKASIHAFEKRLLQAGIGFVSLTGDDASQASRESKRKQFWDDSKTRVLIGTTAIEKSLNLQCANIQVNLDMLYNPSRHQQLAGRVHRVGSIHDEAWVFSLLAKDTIEEHVMNLLKQKQAISDHIFDDTSTVFDQLSTAELYRLIRS